MTMRIFLLLCLTVLLAACSGAGDAGSEALSPAEQTQAQEMLRNYDQARVGENWEVAEATADQLRKKYAASAAAQKVDATLADTRAHAEQMRQARRLRELWDYQAVAVEGGTQRSAAIHSKTVAVEEGEPLPRPDAQLVLRDHPAWGRSVYLLLAQSKFDCGKPCAVTIAFDQAQARRFAGKQADSGKGPALFIVDEKAFIAAMSQARKVRIQLPKGSGLLPSLVFEVGGYDPARYAKP